MLIHLQALAFLVQKSWHSFLAIFKSSIWKNIVLLSPFSCNISYVKLTVSIEFANCVLTFFTPSSDDIISRRCLCQSTLLGFVTPTLTATTLECLLLYAVLPCTMAYALYVCVKPQNKGLNILGANKTYSRGRSRKLWFYNYELALTNNNIKKMAKFSEARRNALVWLQLLYSSVNNPQNQCEEATKKRIEEKELQLQRVRPFQGWHSWGRRMTVYLSQKAESKPNYIFSERTYPNLAN